METKAAIGARISALVDVARDMFDDSDAEVDAGREFLRAECPPRLHRTIDDLPLLSMHVLDHLADGEVNLVGLSLRCRRPKGTVSKHVARLVERNLMRRTPIPENRKEQSLRLTPDGALIVDAHRRLHQLLTERRTRFLQSYTRAELEVVHRVLRDLVDQGAVLAPFRTDQ